MKKKKLKITEMQAYVDEIDEIKIGGYIRWFNLANPENLKLTNDTINN